MHLPLFRFNPGFRGLAMIQNSRIPSERSGGNANKGRETDRHMYEHQADTFRRSSVYASFIRVLPACIGQEGGS